MTANETQVRDLWERAIKSLSAAKQLSKGGFPDDAASRAYYAAFYAASALLLRDDKSFSKHSAVIAHIHKDYVKEGRLPARAGELIALLFDVRLVGDYGSPKHVERAQAQAAITDACTFIQAVRPLLGDIVGGEVE